MCDNHTKCVLGRVDEQNRCTRKDLNDHGYTAMTVDELKEQRSWLLEEEDRKRYSEFQLKRNRGDSEETSS